MFKVLKIKIAKLGNEALWVAVGQILSLCLLFLGVRLLTQVLSPSEYGKLAIIMSIVNGALYSVGQALKLSTTRYFSVMAKDENSNWYWELIDGTIKNAILIFLSAAVIVFFMNIVLKNSWAIGLTWFLTVLMALIVLLNAISYGVQNGARKRKVFAFHQVLFDGTRFGFAFLLAFLLTGSALNALSGFVVAGFVVLVSQFMYLSKEKKTYYSTTGPKNKERTRQFIAYTWPLIIGGVLSWIQIFSDRWAIKSICSYADVGIYFALYQTSYSIWIYGTNMLGNFLGTLFFSMVQDGSDIDRHIKMLKLNEYIVMLFFVAVLTFFFILFPIKEHVCRLLFSEQYGSASELLPWMALSGGIFGIGQQLLYSVYSNMSVGKIIPIRGVGAIAASGLHMTGALIWGVKGVVFGGLIFSCIHFSIAWAAHAKEKRLILDRLKIY